jgi:CHASE3 domain sensor protein
MKDFLSKICSSFILITTLLVLIGGFIYLSRDIEYLQEKVKKKIEINGQDFEQKK